MKYEEVCDPIWDQVWALGGEVCAQVGVHIRNRIRQQIENGVDQQVQNAADGVLDQVRYDT